MIYLSFGGATFYFLYYFQKQVDGIPLPLSKYSFVLARNYIKSLDNTNKAHEFNHKEKVIAIYFESLKSKEFMRSDLNKFNPLKPIENSLESIVDSQLYVELKKMPKGGELFFLISLCKRK